jgi:hypothetical protein
MENTGTPVWVATGQVATSKVLQKQLLMIRPLKLGLVLPDQPSTPFANLTHTFLGARPLQYGTGAICSVPFVRCFG